MNMKKKLVTVCLVACMAVTAVAGGTLAYFTDEAKKDNTFTVGNVDITLSETYVDKNGETQKADEASEEFYGKLMPSREIMKQPIIELEGDSEGAWVFAEVELSDDFATMMKACENPEAPAAKITAEMVGKWFNTQNGWILKSTDDEKKWVYAYETDPLTEEGTKVSPFTAVRVSNNLNDEMVEGEKTFTVTVTAKAIQQEGLETSEDAYKALYNIAE